MILVFAALIAINYFSALTAYRIDYTESKLHSLSDQTLEVLDNLKTDISIKCFMRGEHYSRAAVEHMCKLYARSSSFIRYEFIEPDRNPGLMKRYNVGGDGILIFESGEKERRTAGYTEEDFTSAIIQLTRETTKTIYFLLSHGEASLEPSAEKSYSTAKIELEKMGYVIGILNLAIPDQFPQDIDLLIIPSPDNDLLSTEIEALRQYLWSGGRILFMLNPEVTPRLQAFLEELGIVLLDDVVVDMVSRKMGGDYFMPVVNEYTPHPITQRFQYATFFPYARSVNVSQVKPEGVTALVLARSSANSWSERQMDQPEVSFDETQDQAGPIPLAVVATLRADTAPDAAGQDAIQTEGRFAVFGDSDFANNTYYNLSGNGNLFLNTVNWLSEETDLITIQPRTSHPRTISLSPAQGRLLFIVTVLVLPFVAMLAGVFVWLRRRRL